MREILFRAKRKNWRELPKEEWWVYGDAIHEPIGMTIRHMKQGMPVRTPVDSETLCQYIGIHDSTKWEELSKEEREGFLSKWNYDKHRKNTPIDWKGKRIWENDIISINTYSYMEPEEDYFGQVLYSNGWACWCIQQPDNEKLIPLCECEGGYQTDRFVDGNIFDNSEMLKGE